MKIKTILVSQPEPQNDKSPYAELAEIGISVPFDAIKIDLERFPNVTAGEMHWLMPILEDIPIEAQGQADESQPKE